MTCCAPFCEENLSSTRAHSYTIHMTCSKMHSSQIEPTAICMTCSTTHRNHTSPLCTFDEAHRIETIPHRYGSCLCTAGLTSSKARASGLNSNLHGVQRSLSKSALLECKIIVFTLFVGDTGSENLPIPYHTYLPIP